MNNIELQKTWVQGRPVVVDNLLGTAFTGEAGAHTFKIRGVDAAQEAVTISGTITGKLLAANNVTISLSGSIEDGCAVVTLTDECYDVPGRFIFSVYATSGSTTLCLYCAVGNVLRTDSQVIAYPTESLPNITSLMADLEQILADWPADYSQLQSDVSSLKSATFDNIANTTKPNTTTHTDDGTNIWIAVPLQMVTGKMYAIGLKLSGYTSEQLAQISSIRTYSRNGTSGLVYEYLKNDFGTLVTDETMWCFYTPTNTVNYFRIIYSSGYSSETNTSTWDIRELDETVFVSNDTLTDTLLWQNARQYHAEYSQILVSSNYNRMPLILKAGVQYKIDLTLKNFTDNGIRYLADVKTYSGTSSSTLVDEGLLTLFGTIAANTVLTAYYTPTADVRYIRLTFTSSYSPTGAEKSVWVFYDPQTTQYETADGSWEMHCTPINTFGNVLPDAVKTKLLAAEDDVLVTCVGDSITGLIANCTEQSEPEHCPPGDQYKSWVWQLYEGICKCKPYCDRLDSKRNDSDFFTKTGTWAEVGDEKFSASGETYTYENSVAANTYQSNDASAAVAFALDADSFKKCNIIFSKEPDGVETVIAVTQGNGKLLASLDRTTWAEANGFAVSQNSNPDGYTDAQMADLGKAVRQRHRRIWLKVADDVTGTLNISYSRTSAASTSKYMYCWGVERYNSPAIFFDNLGRGGRKTSALRYNLSDIFDRNPDCCIYEMPLANETSSGLASALEQYAAYFNGSGNTSYKTWSENYTKVPLIVMMPHGRGTFFDAENRAVFDTDHQLSGDPVAYIFYQRCFDYVKTYFAENDAVAVIDMYSRMLNEAQGMGMNIPTAFGGGNGAFTADTVHPSQMGADLYGKYLIPVFQ